MIVHLMFDSHPLPYKKISLYKKKTGKNNKLINKLLKINLNVTLYFSSPKDYSAMQTLAKLTDPSRTNVRINYLSFV